MTLLDVSPSQTHLVDDEGGGERPAAEQVEEEEKALDEVGYGQEGREGAEGAADASAAKGEGGGLVLDPVPQPDSINTITLFSPQSPNPSPRPPVVGEVSLRLPLPRRRSSA